LLRKAVAKENDRIGRRYITLNTEDICQGSQLHGKRIDNVADSENGC